MTEARLTVTVDTASGEELARRITAALEASLATARAEGVTDDETYVSLATGAVLGEVLRVRTDAGAREHCGHLSPQTLLSTPPVECILRPGHSGSHASETNMRWYAVPAPAPAPAAGTLRDQVAAAIARRDYETGLGSDAGVRDHHQGQADAVLAVPAIRDMQATLEQLQAGEEPHTDEHTVPTPGQWIWRWNRASLAQRIEVVEGVLSDAGVARGCRFENHKGLGAELVHEREQREDLRRRLEATSYECHAATSALARVRKLADDLAHPRHLGQHGLPHRLVADEIRGALDPQEQRATPHDVAHPEGS